MPKMTHPRPSQRAARHLLRVASTSSVTDAALLRLGDGYFDGRPDGLPSPDPVVAAQLMRHAPIQTRVVVAASVADLASQQLVLRDAAKSTRMALASNPHLHEDVRATLVARMIATGDQEMISACEHLMVDDEKVAALRATKVSPTTLVDDSPEVYTPAVIAAYHASGPSAVVHHAAHARSLNAAKRADPTFDVWAVVGDHRLLGMSTFTVEGCTLDEAAARWLIANDWPSVGGTTMESLHKSVWQGGRVDPSAVTLLADAVVAAGDASGGQVWTLLSKAVPALAHTHPDVASVVAEQLTAHDSRAMRFALRSGPPVYLTAGAIRHVVEELADVSVSADIALDVMLSAPARTLDDIMYAASAARVRPPAEVVDQATLRPLGDTQLRILCEALDVMKGNPFVRSFVSVDPDEVDPRVARIAMALLTPAKMSVHHVSNAAWDVVLRQVIDATRGHTSTLAYFLDLCHSCAEESFETLAALAVQLCPPPAVTEPAEVPDPAEDTTDPAEVVTDDREQPAMSAASQTALPLFPDAA